MRALAKERGVNFDIIDVLTDPNIRFRTLSDPLTRGGKDLLYYIHPEDTGNDFAQRIAAEIAQKVGLHLRNMMLQQDIDLQTAKPYLQDIKNWYQQIFVKVFDFRPNYLPEFPSPDALSAESIARKRAIQITEQREMQEALKIVNALLSEPRHDAPIGERGEKGKVYFAEVPYPRHVVKPEAIRRQLNWTSAEQYISGLQDFLNSAEENSLWKIIPAQSKKTPESTPNWPGKPGETIKISVCARSKEELNNILKRTKELLERKLEKSGAGARMTQESR